MKSNSLKPYRIHVLEILNGRVVNRSNNTISQELYNYLLASLDSNIDRAIDDLFTASQVKPTGGQQGRDGISMYDNLEEDWITLETTAISPEHGGKRWRGGMVANQQRERTQLALGHDYQTGSSPFSTMFASWVSSGLSIPTGSTYAFEWELSFE